jgi:hypothetical protein
LFFSNVVDIFIVPCFEIVNSLSYILSETLIKFYSLKTEYETYVTTDGQSVSLSWNKAPIWGIRPDFYYCQTVEGLLMRSVLSDDRKCLSFKIAPGLRQRSHFRVGVPWAVTIFYCLRFETSLFVASYDSQGYGGGIGPRLHMGGSA